MADSELETAIEEEPTAEEVEELTDEDLEEVAGGWAGDGDGG